MEQNQHDSGYPFGATPSNGGYRDPEAWVWCGSVIYSPEEQTYFMFASRWSRSKPFSAWATHSEIVLAASQNPEGPYRFIQIILPRREGNHWDGASTHNPVIIRTEAES